MTYIYNSVYDIKGYESFTFKLNTKMTYICKSVYHFKAYGSLPLKNIKNWHAFTIMYNILKLKRVYGILKKLMQQNYCTLNV